MNNLRVQYEEKVVQLQQAKEQIQWANEEVVYQKQIVQSLNNQMNFLQQELKEAQSKQEMNDRRTAQENEKELNKLLQKPQVPSALQRKGLSFVDHKLMTQHNDDTIFSMIQNLTGMLDSHLVLINDRRQSTVGLQSDLDSIVSKYIEADDDFQQSKLDQERISEQASLIQKLEKTIEILEQSASAHTGKEVKYIIKHANDPHAEAKIVLSKHTQTDVNYIAQVKGIKSSLKGRYSDTFDMKVTTLSKMDQLKRQQAQMRHYKLAHSQQRF